MSQKLLLASLGLVFGFAIIFSIRQRLYRLSYWILITGRVIDNKLYGSNYKPVIEFKDRNGHTRQFTEQVISQPHCPWPLHSSIAVRYNPLDSTEAIVDTPISYIGIGLIGLIFAAVVILSGLFLI